MGVTSIKVDSATRDRLAAIAGAQGVSLGQTVKLLIEEHEMAQAIEAVERYRREDPEGWADYQAEIAEWESTASDGLRGARAEYPEYNT